MSDVYGSSIVVNHLIESCNAILVKMQILQICFMMIQTGLHIVSLDTAFLFLALNMDMDLL